MSRDPRLRLQEIIEACERLAGYVDGYDWETFRADLKTQDAVARVFEIIGEAAKGIPEEMREREPEVPGARSRDSATSWLTRISRSRPESCGMRRWRRLRSFAPPACACFSRRVLERAAQRLGKATGCPDNPAPAESTSSAAPTSVRSSMHLPNPFHARSLASSI